VRYLVLTVLLTSSLVAAASDWPQFRGPDGQGHSSETGLPLEWSESEGIQWKVPVPGRGWSSPVVADGRVWLTTGVVDPDGVSLRVLAYNAGTGEKQVEVEVFRIADSELLNLKNSHASPTPIVSGERVYAHFGASGTAALTTSGQVLWTRRFPYVSQHGNGGSPALWEDLLIFSCDGYDRSFVVALDVETGETRWQTNRHEPFSQAYSTPLVINEGGEAQLISVGAFQTVALRPATGEEIWRVVYTDEGFSTVPRPVYGHGLVYVLTGFNQPALLALRADGVGNVSRTHLAWASAQSVPLTSSPLLVGDDLFMVSDLGVVSRMDAATGELRWRARIAGNYSASPVYADGRIYFQSEEGVTTVIAPGEERFRAIATSSVDGATLASMAVSDGSFFLRSDSHLYRIGD
jgi:outer membrane protein assembly factor BamB